jgi:hypothetical protein
MAWRAERRETMKSKRLIDTKRRVEAIEAEIAACQDERTLGALRTELAAKQGEVEYLTRCEKAVSSALAAWPDGDFVKSCAAQLEHSGYLTEPQVAGLEKIKPRRPVSYGRPYTFQNALDSIAAKWDGVMP